MRLNSESIETILERFDRRDDADADYVMAHWREAVDVYEHDGRCSTSTTSSGSKPSSATESATTPTTGSTPLWKTSGNGWSKACSCARRRTAGSGGVPLNWIRGRLDEWIRTAPIDADARYTWTAGLADQSERDVMRVWAEDELAQVVEDHYWNFPGGRNSCMEFYSRPDFISESYVEWKAGLLSEGDLERTDRADTDPLGDPRAFGATTPTR